LPDLDDIFDEELEIEAGIDKVKEIIDAKDGILIPKSDLQSGFIDELKSDKQFLEDLLKEWSNIEEDPKLDNFVDKIKDIQKENPDRKIVVFSMFADTINYLNEKLNDRVLVVT
jgi:ERCC4-related helicase